MHVITYVLFTIQMLSIENNDKRKVIRTEISRILIRTDDRSQGRTQLSDSKSPITE